MNVVAKDSNQRLELSYVCVHCNLVLDVAINNFVVIFSKKAIDFVLLESESLKVFRLDILLLIKMLYLSVALINLLLKPGHRSFIFCLVLALPYLCHCDPLVDLVKHLVTSLLLVKACLHQLQAFLKLVVV